MPSVEFHNIKNMTIEERREYGKQVVKKKKKNCFFSTKGQYADTNRAKTIKGRLKAKLEKKKELNK